MNIRTLILAAFLLVCGGTQAICRPPSQTLSVEARGAHLFCTVFGAGDPIIVLHGGPGLTQDYLLPHMARLGETHQVIFYDQRACGRSTGAVDEESISMATYVQDIEAIRTAFGHKKITLLGHSWGSLLALHYALHHPEQVRALVLVDGAPASPEGWTLFGEELFGRRLAPHQAELQALETSSSMAAGDPKTMERYLRRVFSVYVADPKHVDLLDLRMSPQAITNCFRVLQMFGQDRSYDLHEDLKQLSVPTLIVHGDTDPNPAVNAKRLHESIPGSSYVLLEHCGHFPYVEVPDQFFPCVEAFLAASQCEAPSSSHEE
jgi:proline iminopeptidase